MDKGKAFKSHSVFLYNTKSAIEEFGGKDEFIKSCQELGIQSIWFRSHGTGGLYGDPEYNKDIMKRLSDVGILSAHWGWCQGKGNDHENVNKAIDEYRYFCDTYIADIEPDVNDSKWTKETLDDLINKIKKEDMFLAITTFGFVPWHEPHLWEHVANKIDGWDVQAYWHHLPSAGMVSQGFAEKQNDPAHYCDVCVREWKKIVGQDAMIHLSGQAYWGESGFTKMETEFQWDRFFSDYNGWNKICGFGYWHLSSLMQSPKMVTKLKSANIQSHWENITIPNQEVAKTIWYSNTEYSEHIKEYQIFLKNLGYDIYPDGYAGPMTSNAHKKVFGFYIQGDPRILS